MSYYCKCCGLSFPNERALLSYSCNRSETGKHQLFEGEESNNYFCIYCGNKYPNLRQLCSYSCSASPSKKHIPYEGKDDGLFRGWVVTKK